METVLLKAASLIAVAALAYFLKLAGFFKEEHFGLISKITLNITLPCAVITNFSSHPVEISLLLLTVLGILCDLIMLALGYLVSLRKSPEEMTFNMVNYSGYNIGCFTLPYVQNFLGPAGVVATCMFDAGNAFLALGGSYAIAAGVTNTGGTRISFKLIFKRLINSITLDISLLMLIISAAHITLPTLILNFAEIVGSANSFLAMLMIGIGFRLNLKKGQMGQIAKSLLVRYSMAAVFSLAFYFLLPLPLEIRQAMALVVFAPISASATAYTGKIRGDIAMASTLNSFSILCSTVIMTGIMMLISG